MIADKRIDRIVLIAVAAALLFAIGAIILAPRLMGSEDTGVAMEYEEKIFDTSSPAVINIEMDPDEWRNMLDTSTQEVYHACDVTINGTKFTGVGIRPKGNTSLSSIAMDPDNDRYSFKLEFDQFVDGQTAWGLDKLCLNNNFADASNMKEALVYDMYRYLGADASLYNYAEIYVNGEYWGVYLALEAVEDSFMLRNYGVTNGALYKPDSMSIGFNDDDFSPFASGEPEDEGQGILGLFKKKDRDEAEPAATQTPAPTGAPSAASGEAAASDEADSSGESDASGEAGFEFFSGEMPDFGGPFGGGGQNLNYTDDELDSYSTIWKCEVTDTDTADHRRVVEALKHNSEGTDIEQYMDVDNLLRFMAVHIFSVNGDSLSGMMAHNYYLYESGGSLNVLPWDYNLSFGGMSMGGSSAKSVVNEPIDDSWQSTDFFDCLLENEEYLAKYHAYYQQLIDEYVFGGGFNEFYSRTREQIDDLVAADPNALYDYDEYDTAAKTLYQLVMLRGESISGQLSGTIPSTDAGQRLNSDAFIQADYLDLSVMGSMGGGGFPLGNRSLASGEASDEAAETDASAEPAEDAASEEMQTDTASDEIQEDTASGEAAEEEDSASGEWPFPSGEMQKGIDTKTIWTWVIAGVVLAGGLCFAILFKKKG